MEKNKIHILVVDDDDRIRDLLKEYLNENNFIVSTAIDAEDAKIKLDYFRYDLIVLDVMMPGKNGYELTKDIKKKINTPVILLTAKGEVENRIKGLELGADDYLGKPFEPQELLLRIKAILRRTEENKLISKHDKKLIRFGDVSYNPDISAIWKNNNKVTLTSKENQLLQILLEGKGNTINRYILINNLKLGSRGIDITISRLRKKIENNPKSPSNILTIRGEGYALPQNTLDNQ